VSSQTPMHLPDLAGAREACTGFRARRSYTAIRREKWGHIVCPRTSQAVRTENRRFRGEKKRRLPAGLRDAGGRGSSSSCCESKNQVENPGSASKNFLSRRAVMIAWFVRVPRTRGCTSPLKCEQVAFHNGSLADMGQICSESPLRPRALRIA
jgi:hypothetical protein